MRRPDPEATVVAPRTKRCTICDVGKSIDACLPSRFTDDGHTDTCKTCTYAHAERDRREREARRQEFQRRKHNRKRAPAGVTTKICRTCSTAKPLAEYDRHGRSHADDRVECS